MDTFLDDVDADEIPWQQPSGMATGIRADRVLIAEGPDALEVVVAQAESRPKAEEVRRLWSVRWNRRAAPVVLVVGYPSPHGWKVAVCGTKDSPTTLSDLDPSQVERVCTAALEAHSSSEGERLLQRLITAQKDQVIPGLTNTGLFASHELRTNVPRRPDWASNHDQAVSLLGRRGLDLISGLGYTAMPHGSAALILSGVDGSRRAVAVLLNEDELFDRPSARWNMDSPLAYGLAVARQQNLSWLLATRGTQIRLYPAQPNVGVGRKGQTETYTELDLALLDAGSAAYLTLLFAADALAPGSSVDQILAASADHAAALGARLRDRVYEDVVPALSVAVANQMGATSDAELSEAYHRTLIILFRLLFVAYAEDRGLLPYQRNPRYTRKALKTLAREFVEFPDQAFDEQATDRWDDLLAVWRAIDNGNAEWDVPAYNGGLFASDEAHPSGAAIARMRLTNAEIGPALRGLLVDTGDDGVPGPVDFRSLSVREFGTIYEGLLESSLSIAPSDLTIDPKKNAYLPAKPGQQVVVPAGQVYFHNASGQRKGTGSYFTKAFAVEHLLDTALEPALSAHLAKVQALLEQGDDAGAAELFFDFRVADLAMGSGHFLVAAIDRIENRFAAFLVEHPISPVTTELQRLADTARQALGARADEAEIERSALLRRQIARRCIYGLDLNLMAVELARLAIWIHTFVPGLPMSTLDHGLVVGNSLTGMGTLDEVLEVLEPKRLPGQASLFADEIESALSQARDRLVRMARTAEATKQEVHEARRAHEQALSDSADAKALLDAAVAVRLGTIRLPTDPEQTIRHGQSSEVREAVAKVEAVHPLYQFPEVFLRKNSGFDVILGNPPWEKVRWEAAPYWVGVSPGLMALEDKDRDAKIEELRKAHPIEARQEKQQQELRAVQQGLFKKSYTLRGGTHLDLAQLMLERALHLLSPTGRLGLVLPRQSMVLAGWKKLRQRLVHHHDLQIVQGRNHGEWIFDGIHASYAVVLLAAGPQAERTIHVGVARSVDEVKTFSEDRAITFRPQELASMSDTNVIPWFNTPNDRSVFDSMRDFPLLSSGKGWIQGRHDARWDFTSSGPDNKLVVRSNEKSSWKVLMTAHVDAFSFDWKKPFKQFVSDLRTVVAKERGVSVVNGTYVLDDQHPLIIFRRPSRSVDSRTLIATALPESGILHNKGYIHAVMHSLESAPEQRLALLGLLNTLTVDWWARRFVDRHVTAPIVNQIRLPAWSESDIATAAEITASLLARSGSTRLAGGIEVKDSRKGSDTDLRAELEQLALRGYGLDDRALTLIAEDFNDKGLPPELRAALGLTGRNSK